MSVPDSRTYTNGNMHHGMALLTIYSVMRRDLELHCNLYKLLLLLFKRLC